SSSTCGRRARCPWSWSSTTCRSSWTSPTGSPYSISAGSWPKARPRRFKTTPPSSRLILEATHEASSGNQFHSGGRGKDPSATACGEGARRRRGAGAATEEEGHLARHLLGGGRR